MSSRSTDVTDLCDLLDEILDGECRTRILEGVSSGASLTRQLGQLRAAMAAHTFEGVPGRFGMLVQLLDRRTGQDGFRVLHSWNHTTHAFTDDLVPVLLLDFFERAEVPEPDARPTLAILLDYYFMHVLALCAMRVWDTDGPDELLDRLTLLVGSLQGGHGSGHQFVQNSETLLIYALSQFHPEEQAYDRMIVRVGTLTDEHQFAFARVSAAVLSAHLRWGFWLMYDRDVVRMREDNVGDYPWLLSSALTLLRAYAKLEPPGASEAFTSGAHASGPPASAERQKAERQEIVGALVLALSADPWAFRGTVPAALESYRAEYAELREILSTHGVRLLEDMEAHRPTREAFAPLALHFNFPHNTLVAIVTLALLESKPQALPLNALFEAEYDTNLERETQEGLARLLMAFSGGSPDRLGYRGAMLVAYDPLSGMRSFSMTVDTLRKSL